MTAYKRCQDCLARLAYTNAPGTRIKPAHCMEWGKPCMDCPPAEVREHFIPTSEYLERQAQPTTNSAPSAA